AFVGLQGAVRSLDRSLDAFYARSRFADLVVVGGDAHAFARSARAAPGVDAVSVRTTTTLSVWIGGGRTKVQGTVIGVPPGPAIDALTITSGHAFARGTTEPVAIVEQHTADGLGIAAGARVQALGIGSVEDLTVTGVAVSPEYLLPAQSQQQVVSAPGSFAVLYVPEAVARRLGGPAGTPQVLVRDAPGTDAGAVARRLTRLATRTRADLVERRAQQPSNAVLAEERTGFELAGLVLPGLALALASLVGALAASIGREPRVSARRLVVTVGASAAIGAGVGWVAALVAGARLADSVSLPTHQAAANLGVVLAGIALGVVAGAVGLVIAALAGRNRDATLGAGPAVVTACAAVAAVVCVIAPAGVVNSAEATLDAAADLERVDSQVAFAAAVTAADVHQLLAVEGVAAAEPVPSAEVVVAHGRFRYATELEAFSPHTTMQRFQTPGGAPLGLPARGVLVPRALGTILHAHPGDELEIELPGAGVAPARVPLAAFTSDTLGNLVFLRISTLRAALGDDANSFAGGLFDTATIRFRADADPGAIARSVQALPGVAVYVPVQADLDSVDQARPIFTAVIAGLLAIGALIALLGITSAVAVHAHTRARHGTVRLAVEVGAAVLAGMVVGSVLGTLLANRLVARLDTDLIHLVRHIAPSTYVIAWSVVVAVSALTLAASIVTLRIARAEEPERVVARA
ncbi:MAG TPA: hypothetical protein VEP49_00540, partial [Acidimicrobiia bacterium]|nr:hypothetical protein [Acidimicrobiia bacterium]